MCISGRYCLLAIYILIALILLILSFVCIGGWIASEKLLRVTEKWYAVTLNVIGVTEDTITLPRKVETAYDGTYGISWLNDYAILGEIVASDNQTVTRRIIKTTQSLSAGMSVDWNIFVYSGDPENTLGLAYENLRIPSQLGLLPVYFVPGQRTTWVLLVHGFHATGEEGLRVLPTLAAMGFPVMLMYYRNDSGAPLSPDHFYHLGDTEWQDVESGARYALEHGAQDVVLYGWSMGGCIVEAFMRRSSNAEQVRAVVLDSPILDWHQAMDTQMHKLHFPHWFTYVAEWFVARRAKIDFAALNYLSPPRNITTPTLLFHGTEDGMVPIGSSDTFAQTHPDLVTYQRVNGADHTQAWNLDQQAYESALKTFLTRVTEPASDTLDQLVE
jgi:uncharacterized protein